MAKYIQCFLLRITHSFIRIFVTVAGLWPLASYALGPHEVVVLINDQSPRSKHVANEYISLRGVPAANVVYLDLPKNVLEPKAEVSHEAFTAHLWQPALAKIKQRGIEDHILAWVYSVDFPIRIKAGREVSLQGITFVRNKLPEATLIEQGRYFSSLYAGPMSLGGHVAPSYSLEKYTMREGASMPLPSMMLGFMGSRGNEMAAVLKHLEAGKVSDVSHPTGTVYFVRGDDVRSTCRHWQFDTVVDELANLGVAAHVVSNVPLEARDIMGVMMGTPWTTPFFGANAYSPGCMAEHLTSGAAVFHHYDQTKLCGWLHAGATASAGTVTEPMAIWSKFPNAHFYAHYARG